MTSLTKTSRRNFIKIAAATGGGLMLGFHWSESSAGIKVLRSPAENITFNSYLQLSPDGIITLFSPNPELGQNVKTSFPLIVAEELDADWSHVRVVQAPLDTKRFDRQVTGGSGAIPHSWERLRKAGATARQMLLEAAAKRWKVPASTLIAENSTVIHKKSGRKLSYGELAADAAKVPVPSDVPLKDPSTFKLIGKPIANIDNHEMVTGQPLYGLDFYREGMQVAMVQRPPFGKKIKSIDDSDVRKVPGITDVVTFGENIAIVGKSTWPVMKARRALKVEYEPDGVVESTADHDRVLKELLDSPESTVRRSDGDVASAFRSAAKVIRSEYQCPFLSHAPLEPMNFFAHVRPDGVELVGPTQTPERARNATATLLGISPEKITLELTRLGGGFGRRLQSDYVLDAVHVSRLIKGPVKVMWTREDDQAGGHYRPAVRYRFEAALDDKGNMTGYKLRGVGINAGNSTREHNFPSGAVDNLLIDSIDYSSPITTGAWRAPITNFLAFAEQSFLDEVARAANKDPIAFRLELLERAKRNPVGEIHYDIDRMISVTKLVAEKAGWGKKSGVFQGFSVYFSHRSYVAQIAEVEINNNSPVLKKIYAAADCGIVVNLSGARQQVVGGIVDGFGHAMFGNLTFRDGLPEQRNFHDYRLVRMKEVPAVEVHFVDNGISPTGLGEPALPPTGGAVANAFFAATGKRLRNQPFILQDEMKESGFGGKL